MACCGYKNCAIAAGILGLVQAGFGLALDCYFLDFYFSNAHIAVWNGNYGNALFLLYATRDVYYEIEVMLIISVFLNLTWIASSIVLLVANSVNNACCTRQWVVTTSFIIAADIIFPAFVIGYTLKDYLESVDRTKALYPQVLSHDVYKYYILLIVTFMKGALITLILNTFLDVYTNLRASEIIKEIHSARQNTSTAPVTCIWEPTQAPPFPGYQSAFTPAIETFPRADYPRSYVTTSRQDWRLPNNSSFTPLQEGPEQIHDERPLALRVQKNESMTSRQRF